MIFSSNQEFLISGKLNKESVFNIIDKHIEESESKHYMEIAKSYTQGLRAGLAESEE